MQAQLDGGQCTCVTVCRERRCSWSQIVGHTDPTVKSSVLGVQVPGTRKRQVFHRVGVKSSGRGVCWQRKQRVDGIVGLARLLPLYVSAPVRIPQNHESRNGRPTCAVAVEAAVMERTAAVATARMDRMETSDLRRSGTPRTGCPARRADRPEPARFNRTT